MERLAAYTPKKTIQQLAPSYDCLVCRATGSVVIKITRKMTGKLTCIECGERYLYGMSNLEGTVDVCEDIRGDHEMEGEAGSDRSN